MKDDAPNQSGNVREPRRTVFGGPRIYRWGGPLEGIVANAHRASRLGFSHLLIPLSFVSASGGRVGSGAQSNSGIELASTMGATSVRSSIEEADIPVFAELDLFRAESGAPGDLDRISVSRGLHRCRFALDHGCRGILLRRVPDQRPEFWNALLSELKGLHPGCFAIADVLGASPEHVLLLARAGFDSILDSAAWWDFREDWLLEQYRSFQLVISSISFPEPFSEPARSAGRTRPERRLRAIFAALFSAGWLLPVFPGDEDREDRAAEWEALLAALNAVRQQHKVFEGNGGQQRLLMERSAVVALLRWNSGTAASASECGLLALNPDEERSHPFDYAALLRATEGRFDLVDRTPLADPADLGGGSPLVLAPLEARVFAGVASAPKRRPVLRPQARPARSRLPARASARVAIENVEPELDAGRFSVKRIVGGLLHVEADIFADGHDQIGAVLKIRALDESNWREIDMAHLGNDRWRGEFLLERVTRFRYTIEAWVDSYSTWCVDTKKKHDAGQDVAVDLVEGRGLIETALAGSSPETREPLADLDRKLRCCLPDTTACLELMVATPIRAAMKTAIPRGASSTYPVNLEIAVDRPRAAFSAWYEMFPRSQSGDASRHGTFDDVITRLPYVRDSGFDVLYFPPIHPIGLTNRKGPNNSLAAGPDDPGSPYAIGAEAGGHCAIHPTLGTLHDFSRLVAAAHEHGLEIALDFAVQCSLDHPWIREHPEWFQWRPDNTIRYAENPPKKYEDIVNLRFHEDGRPVLPVWNALHDVVAFWIEHGVRIFRVDNPHTKPFAFWEWLIQSIGERHPDVIFLSEAFTRPKVMKRLAKAGFQQSYTYFTWRNTKAELTDYMSELVDPRLVDYFRPNFFTNTPDINPYYLQTGNPAGFRVRATLAATLSPSWGIYSGFELCEGRALAGREEYRDSEKYQLKEFDWHRSGNIVNFIAALNRIRRNNPALHELANLRFYNAWNDSIIVYGKMTRARENAILVAVNLDQTRIQSCPFEVPLWEFGLPDQATIDVEDLLSGQSLRWQGKIQHLTLDPQLNPVAIWRLKAPSGFAG